MESVNVLLGIILDFVNVSIVYIYHIALYLCWIVLYNQKLRIMATQFLTRIYS
jgi:hypothetical protein